MNDAYNDALDRMEQTQAEQWEIVEEDKPAPPGDDDAPLTPKQIQWIFDHF